MFEAKITLDCTSRFESAIYRLAEILGGRANLVTGSPDNGAAVAPAPVTGQPAPNVKPANTAVPDAYAVPSVNPATPDNNVVPLAAAPTYTLEQVSNAGASLIAANPAKMAELQALLAQFNTNAVANLKPDQIGAFATALRGLGANI